MQNMMHVNNENSNPSNTPKMVRMNTNGPGKRESQPIYESR